MGGEDYDDTNFLGSSKQPCTVYRLRESSNYNEVFLLKADTAFTYWQADGFTLEAEPFRLVSDAKRTRKQPLG